MTTPQTAQPPRLSFKAQMHRAREDAIVEAASRLLCEKGFETMTVDEVAAAVGIAKASLYKHFAGKDDLCAAAMAHGMQQLQAFVQALEPALPAPAKLQALLRWQLQWQLGHEVALWLAPRHSALAQALRSCDAYQQAQQALRSTLVGWIEAAQAAGQLRTDLPAEALLCALLARTAEPMVALLRECGAYGEEQVIDWAVQTCLDGLRPR
ncbi:TetR/AcrR family transcriptional regulator [Pulveribacter suum]|uniref:TetR/AcrR family transcriptional regulator n=1 Tax=Pulveribacter suum TaxID=2116657 RepID=UPI0014754163|nr:TetR/AcrR family transcriptional regulator [Pulveribacter suum]